MHYRIICSLGISKVVISFPCISLQVSTKEPAIVTTGNTNVTQTISSLCDLLMQYELVSKVYGDGDLKVLIGQNLMDACRWVCLLIHTGC